MELIARFFYSLTVYCGWLLAPIYSIFAFRPTKLLPPLKRPDILNLSAVKLADKIRKKELTSEQVMSAFIERCRDVNGVLNAIVEDRFIAALEDAKNVDQFISSGQKTEEQLKMEFPLLGVPITVKEACKVEGLSYSVGAKLRKGIKSDGDGKAVAKLKEAGAIPIAVTNTPELCASIETLNYITGYTVNPYDTTRTSGGSSGGEAALISSAASTLGVGSDFGGSIRVPCLFTGIFGHKPTPGIVSNDGHYPNLMDKEYQKLLTIGPMCRYAEDLKASLKIMAGENAVALNLDSEVNIADLKIYYNFDKGFTLSELSVNSDFKKSIKLAVEYFELTYGCTTEKLNLPELNDITEICIMQAADVENLKEVFFLKGVENESNLYLELIKGLTHFSDYCLQTVIMRFVVESLLFIPCYKRFKYSAERNDLSKRIKETLGENGVFIFPTFTTTAFHKYELIWKISSMGYPMMVNVLGLPATQVPTGLNKKGLPIGFQVVAAPNQDRLCIAVAQELEKLFGGWVPPPSSYKESYFY